MRVAIAEDSGFFRDALASALECIGVEITATCENADDLLDAITKDRPDAAIVDICLPPTKTDEGLVAAEKIGKLYPEVGVLILSAYLATPHVTRMLSSRKYGVGALSKDQLHDTGVLMKALRRIVEGGVFVDPEFVDSRFHVDYLRKTLTKRELEILRSLAEGYTNQAISDRLLIGVKTVESSLTTIFRKLQIDSGETRNARVAAVLTYLGRSQRFKATAS